MVRRLMEDALLAGQISGYAWIPAAQIPVSLQIRQMCRDNQCGKYNSCWTCPPGVGREEDIWQKLSAYTDACVFTCTGVIEDSFDFEGMMRIQQKTQRLLRRFMVQLRAQNLPFMALGCEGCGICPQCTYPNAPCRFPELAVPSLEACGILVMELAKRTGLRYSAGIGTVTYFCVIVYKGDK